MEDHHVGAMMTRSELRQLPQPWESGILYDACERTLRASARPVSPSDSLSA
jgi:hypothetical protein